MEKSKVSKYIVLSSNKNKFLNKFNAPIHLDEDNEYEIALVSFDMFYCIPNLTKENNTFKYSYNSGTSWEKTLIQEGCYTLENLYNEIKRVINIFDNKMPFSFDAKTSNLKTVVNITDPNFQIDFKYRKSFGHMLGFSSVLKHGYNESKHSINMLINRIFIKTNLAELSWYNDKPFPFLYNFFPNVLPGEKIIENPNPLIYHHLNNKSLQHVEISLVDENGKEIDLNGETVTIELHIRSKN